MGPFLILDSAALSVAISFMNYTCVENKKEGNVDILGIIVMPPSQVGIPYPITNMGEEGLHRILHIMWSCHIVVLINKLYVG
jgi:hypothetical protein